MSNFNQITINTAVFGGSGTITGATAIASSFSATINSPTLVTFSTTPGFIPALPAIYVVGQVCFDNNSVAFFPGQMVISNGPMDNCAVTSFQDDLTTICSPTSPCDSLFLADTSVCTIDKSLLMPLYGCSNIPCVTQVKWYVQSPCGIGPFVLYQVKPDCSDLLLFPYQFSTDICVYAEVITDGSCSCPILTTTNTATIQLCDPVSCSIKNPTPELCDCDTPMPLSVNLSGVLANCLNTVSWYDGQGNLVGNSPTYAPPLLCFQGPLTDCYQDYVYKAVIDSPCGKDSCFASIRVYNDNAPTGSLVMNPSENQPLPGQ
ncbi:MAG: hypothetical protein IPH04_01335 [Saprospirales bacterium]|nr:hypothetical protein [Saprospirales bacterium]